MSDLAIKISCSTCRKCKFNGVNYVCKYKKKGFYPGTVGGEPCEHWIRSRTDIRLWIKQHKESVLAKVRKYK